MCLKAQPALGPTGLGAELPNGGTAEIGFRPGWLKSSRLSLNRQPEPKRQRGFANGTSQGPREGRQGQLGARPTSYRGGASHPRPHSLGGAGPAGTGRQQSPDPTLAPTFVFQRLPLDHNSQGLSRAASLPDLASPPALRAVSEPPRIVHREL